MTAKEYLKQYKKANKKLIRLEQDLYNAETNIAAGGMKMDGMPRSQRITSKTENDAITISNLKREIIEQKELIPQKYEEIRQTIEKLIDEDQKNILSALYLWESKEDPESHVKPTIWRVVAKMVHISERQGQRIHGKALQEVEKIRKEAGK